MARLTRHLMETVSHSAMARALSDETPDAKAMREALTWDAPFEDPRVPWVVPVGHVTQQRIRLGRDARLKRKFEGGGG